MTRGQKNPNAGKKQPAKSAKAAELLGKSPASHLTFASFGGLATPGYVPAVSSTSQGMDLEVPEEVQACLRKLTKKDPTTKIKALIQLNQQFAQLSDDVVKGVLSHWARAFGRLTTEYDHPVREAAMRAHDALVKQAGKNLESQLKAVAPYWVCAMFDSHNQTAKLARSSWQMTFRDEKSIKALRVCQEELIKYFEYNLLHETPESLCELSQCSPEEKQMRYERLLSASLLSLDYILQMLSSEDEPDLGLEDKYGTLLDHKAVWKLLRDGTTQAAFLTLLSTLCSRAPGVVNKHLQRISTSVFGLLHVTDVKICRPLWEAVLQLVSKYPKCWDEVNVTKQVFPNLFKMLRVGGGPSSSIVLPNMLPFLSKIPRELQGTPTPETLVTDFRSRFFHSLRDGALSRRTDDSSRLLLSCYLDCLRYTLLQVPLLPEVEKDVLFVDELALALLETQLLPLIEGIFNDSFIMSTFFELLNNFLRLLLRRVQQASRSDDVIEKQADVGSSERHPREADLLPEQFWEEFEAILVKEIKRPGQSKAKMDRLSALLVCLSLPSQDGKLKSEEEERDDSLLDLVNAVGAEAFNIGYQTGSVEHVRLFSRMLRTSGGSSLLRYSLQADFSGSYVKDVQSELPQAAIFTDFEDMMRIPRGREAEVFLQWVVLPWLVGQNTNLSGMIKLCAVEVVFAAAMHAPCDDRLRLLDQVCDMCGQDVIVLCAMVRQAVVWLQDAQSDHASLMQQWLASHTLGEKLIVQVWKAANAASPPLAFSADLTIYENSEVPDSCLTNELTIFHSVQLLLRPGPNRELLMSVEHAEIIFAHTWQMFEESLPDRSKALLAALQLAKSYFDNLAENGTMLKGAKNLLYTLFKATCDPDPAFSGDVIKRMRDVWKRGLSMFARQRPSECQEWCDQVIEWSHDVLLSSALTSLDSVKELAVTASTIIELTGVADPSTPAPARFARLVPHPEQWSDARILAGRSGTCSISLVQGTLSLHNVIPDSFPAASEPSTVRRMSANKLFRRRSSDAAVRRAGQPAPSVHTQCAVFTCEVLAQFRTLLRRQLQVQSGGGSGDASFDKQIDAHVLSGITDTQLCILCGEITWDIQWLYGVPRICRELYNLDDPDAITWAALPILEPLLPKLLQELKERNELPMVFRSIRQKSEEDRLIWSAVFHRLLEETGRCGYSIAQCDVSHVPGQFTQLEQVTRGQIHTLQSLLSVMGRGDAPEEIAILQSVCGSLGDGVLSAQANELQGKDSLHFGQLCGCISSLEQLVSLKDGVYADKELIMRLLAHFMKWRDDQPDLFLFDCELPLSSSHQVPIVVEVLRLLIIAVQCCADRLTASHWDFVLCSLLAWLQTCRQTQPQIASTTGLLSAATRNEGFLRCMSFTTFCCHVSKLLCGVVETLSPATGDAPKVLKEQWEQAFGHAVYEQFVPLFMACADAASVTLSLGRDPIIACFHQLLEHLALSIYLMPTWLVEGNDERSSALLSLLRGELDAEHCEGNDISKEFARRMSLLPPIVPVLGGSLPSLLLSPSCAVQAAAFFTISKMVPEIVKKGKERLQLLREDGGEGNTVTLPADLTMLMGSMADDVDTWLSTHGDHRQNEQIIVPRAQMIYRTATAYFLAWQLGILIINKADPELRAQYANGLRDGTELGLLLKALFQLMPQQPDSSIFHPLLPLGMPSRSLPLTPVHQHVGGRAPPELWWNVPELACNTYMSVVRQLPVLVRQWWNSIDRRFYQFVEKFTTQHVSSVLLQHELQTLQESMRSFNNMEVRARLAAREVVAVYTVDEISIELVVQLPASHPLRPSTVECSKKVGVSAEQWRRWLLQLTTFLANQNGSILDGLALWKQSLDRRLDGLDDCMICFSVIHGSNCSLPKLSCRTCKKKFHSACLYKWFSTSNASTCPLCRNLF